MPGLHRVRRMNPVIRAENVSVIRDGHHILNKVSLSVSEQDFITIIGPNGAGKSTLLKCLMGFFKPDRGQIYRYQKLQIGYVPQRIVADHVMPISVRRFLGLRKKIDMAELGEVVEETEIRPILDTPLHVLSGG